MIGVVNIGGNGGGVSFDTIPRVRYYGLLPAQIGTKQPQQYVNAGPNFDLLKGEILIISCTQMNRNTGKAYIQKFILKDTLPGNYGTGGTALADINFEGIFTTNTSALEDPNSQVIIIDDLGGLSLSSYVNAANPAYVIQASNVGLVFFTVGDESFLFAGNGGTYGFGQMQTTDDDFKPFDDEVVISKTSELENDGEGIAPFISDISVQNGNGFEQFKSKEVKFEGVSFDVFNKKIKVDPLVKLSAFLDVVNGSDVNGILENGSRPFKTLAALFNALPATTGETYTIYITGGNIPVTRRVPVRDIKWIAATSATLNFTNVMEDNGTTHAQNVQQIAWGQEKMWTFENDNISILCDYVGNKNFTYSAPYSGLKIKGIINNLQWKSGGFIVPDGTEFTITNLYDTAQSVSELLRSYSDTQRPSTINVKNHFPQYGTRIAGSQHLNLNIGNITKIGALAFSLTIYGNSVSILGNVNLQGCTLTPNCNKLSINGTLSSTCQLDLLNVPYVTGIIESTMYSKNAYMAKPQVFENFRGKLNNILQVTNGTLTFINSTVEVQDVLMTRWLNSGETPSVDGVFFKGFNTITQIDTTTDLFTTTASVSDRSINIKIEGEIKSNVKSYGVVVKSVYPTATFKQKLNEVVIRSKKDLVNRVLDSTMNYIIDGIINDFLPTDKVIVPAGGLSLSGYGFSVSALKAFQNNSLLFSSPAGGCGNLFLSNISLEASGVGSKVFDMVNAGAPTGGADAIELNVVNFDNCTSLGNLTNFRQGLWNNVGIFGVKDGLTFHGVWSGGFRADLTIVRNFGIADTVSTLFKKGNDLLFKSRLLTDINVDFKNAGSLSDFQVANFAKPKLYQIKAAQITRNGDLDPTQNYTGDITAFSSVSDWSGNNGIPNSTQQPYGINTDKLKICANDADAFAQGVLLKETYIETATGYFKTRLA